jgi:hypothetical protein
MNPTATEARRGHEAAPFASLSRPLAPTKTVLLTVTDAAAKRDEIRHYFHQTCEIYDRLFTLIKEDASYYERHDGTMHEHVQRTTHRRSTLGAGTLSR